MNEDLKWLAENEHQWKEGAEYVGRSVMGYCLWFNDDDSIPAGVDVVFMRPEWQSARDELSGKPGWELAPKSAKIRAQQDDGLWFFGSQNSAAANDDGSWTGDGSGVWFLPSAKGRVLGDWRNTLERRPQAVEFNLSGSKYLRQIKITGDGRVDVYAVLLAFNVTCPATQHAIKKLLCAGLRGKGDKAQDLAEARDAVTRAIQLLPPDFGGKNDN